MGFDSFSFYLLSFALSLIAALHVVLYKRNSRSAAGWIGLIWLSPVIGPMIYYLFGINRLKRRALALRPGSETPEAESSEPLTGLRVQWRALVEAGDRITGKSPCAGNDVTPLWNGEAAYPQMLDAIRKAKKSIGLSTYIFDRDPAGLEFSEALIEAHERGVQVRVLIDDVGARYSLWPVDWRLHSKGVRTARFLPVFNFRSFHFMNMRMHRKLLVVDGTLAFTGGMNIRQDHRVTKAVKKPIRDAHFRVVGPSVSELVETFALDWWYTTGERLGGDPWFSTIRSRGQMYVRTMPDGPDQRIEKTRWIVQSAISLARDSIQVMTPYFVPDQNMIMALNTASLRGVKVQIVIPENNNLPWCHWATQAILWQILEQGVEVYFFPGDFDHTKMMVVDDSWNLVGSSNWDERSWRLNFELNLEVYSKELASELSQHIEEQISRSRRVTLAEMDGRSTPARIRDGVARLFTPML